MSRVPHVAGDVARDGQCSLPVAGDVVEASAEQLAQVEASAEQLAQVEASAEQLDQVEAEQLAGDRHQ